jgi:hypothetical protein
MTDTAERFFFVHVMKTGGSTFRQHVLHNFPAAGAVYPDPELDGNLVAATTRIQRLLALPKERHARIRAYTGHFPFVLPRLLDPQLVTLTVLRDPVERTISYLKECKRSHPRLQGRPLEEIYEDTAVFFSFICDHQTKIFSMTPADRLESYMEYIEIDEERLRIAKANLEAVDVVGLNSAFDDFLADVQRRYGWEIRERPNRRVSKEPWDVSDSFRERIATDNANDVAFYRFACDLIRRRRD